MKATMGPPRVLGFLLLRASCTLLCPSIDNTAAATGSSGTFRPLPKEAGHFHNKILERVGDVIAATSPQDASEYSDIVLREMLSLCGTVDQECDKVVRDAHLADSVRLYSGSGRRKTQQQVPLRQDHGADDGVFESSSSFTSFFVNGDDEQHPPLPETEDKVLRHYLGQIYETTSRLRELSLRNVTDRIASIAERVEEKDDVTDAAKTVIRAVASVAAGSAAYWSEAETNPENGFRRLFDTNAANFRSQRRRGRRLAHRRSQGNDNDMFGDMVTPLVLADVTGAVRGGLSFGAASFVTSVLDGGAATTATIALQTTVFGISSSLLEGGVKIGIPIACESEVVTNLLIPSWEVVVSPVGELQEILNSLFNDLVKSLLDFKWGDLSSTLRHGY